MSLQCMYYVHVRPKVFVEKVIYAMSDISYRLWFGNTPFLLNTVGLFWCEVCIVCHKAVVR